MTTADHKTIIEYENNEKTITIDELKKMFKDSKNAKKNNETITMFFGNCVMGKILDLLLDNPKTAISLSDLVDKIDISRKSLYSNMLILTSSRIVTEIEVKKQKFYLLNTKNPITKHISKLRDMLNIDYVEN